MDNEAAPADQHTVAAVHCFHHGGRETGLTCTRCDRPACWECLTPAAVGSHCWQCIKAAQPPLRERVRRRHATSTMVVTSALVAVNLAVFVCGLLPGSGRSATTLTESYALFGPSVAAGEWWRLVTSGFLHTGAMHLALNMLALWRLGASMEEDIGRGRFLAIYTISLLGGSAGALLLTPDAVTVGASGAIFGLAGAATSAVWRRGTSLRDVPWMPFIVVNLVLSVAVPGISLGGHLGGLVAGAVAGGLLLDPRARTRVAAVVITVLLAATCVAASLTAVGRTYGSCKGSPTIGYYCDVDRRG